MKRETSRTPSPQRKSKPKIQGNAMVDAVPGSQRNESDVQMSAEDHVLMKLKPLNGTPPTAFSASVSDNENGRTYCIQSNNASNSSELWCLHIDTMKWENIPIHAFATDIFFPEKLPYRHFPGLALFGPKDHRRLLLFGGQDAAIKSSSELFYIDLTTNNFNFLPVAGGSVAGRVVPSMFLVDDCRLFIVGGLSAGKWLNTFSLAVYDPLTHLWSWHEKDRQFSSGLEASDTVFAAPVYDGKKALLVGTSSVKDKKFLFKNENIFTFDPKTYTAVQDSHAQPGAPSLSFDTMTPRPGPAANEISLFVRGTEKYELWSYRAFPENEWKFLLEFPRGRTDVQVRSRYVIVCMGKTFILIADKRDGKQGVTAYIQVDDVVDVNTHSSS